jgi:hypothetical protein
MSECTSGAHDINEIHINDLGREAQVPHACPFKEEIRGDETTLCECCENCTNQCARDI